MASFITNLALALAAASTVSAHAFFHKAIVNGVDQGQLFGVRAPESNSPIQDVTSSAITCNSPLHQPLSKDVITVAGGDTFGMQWNHNIGGEFTGWETRTSRLIIYQVPLQEMLTTQLLPRTKVQ